MLEGKGFQASPQTPPVGMERKRQQYCVAVGAVLILVAGVIVGSGGLLARSETVRALEPGLSTSLIRLSIALLVLGFIGLFLALVRWRWALFTYAWLSLALCIACGVSGAYFTAGIVSDAWRFDHACEVDQATGDVSSQRAAAIQRAYNSMVEALLGCRQSNPLALRLESCPTATDKASVPWQSNDFVNLLRMAEGRYACSGFCENGIPLFGLPGGTVDETNKAVQRPACFAQITAELRQKGKSATSALLIAAGLLLVPVCSACWLACAPPPARRKGYIHRSEELEWMNPDGHSRQESLVDIGSDHAHVSTRGLSLEGGGYSALSTRESEADSTWEHTAVDVAVEEDEEEIDDEEDYEVLDMPPQRLQDDSPDIVNSVMALQLKEPLLASLAGDLELPKPFMQPFLGQPVSAFTKAVQQQDRRSHAVWCRAYARLLGKICSERWDRDTVIARTIFELVRMRMPP